MLLDTSISWPSPGHHLTIACPPLAAQAVNREFGEGEESRLRASLASGGVLTVPYKCNRAVLFISDQYHESLPFRFAPGEARASARAAETARGPAAAVLGNVTR